MLAIASKGRSVTNEQTREVQLKDRRGREIGRCCHGIFGVAAVRHHTPLHTRAHTLLQSKHNTANTIRVSSVVSHASVVVHSCDCKKAMTVSHHHCYYTRVHAQQRVGCSESGIVQRIIRACCACCVAHAITRKRPERKNSTVQN